MKLKAWYNSLCPVSVIIGWLHSCNTKGTHQLPSFYFNKPKH